MILVRSLQNIDEREGGSDRTIKHRFCIYHVKATQYLTGFRELGKGKGEGGKGEWGRIMLLSFPSPE